MKMIKKKGVKRRVGRPKGEKTTVIRIPLKWEKRIKKLIRNKK